MRKSRMTKSERLFVERVNAIVFNPATIRDGKPYLNVETFKALPIQAQERYRKLLLSKTY